MFIAITQMLFIYSIVHPVFGKAGVSPNIFGHYTFLLILSSVLVAAGGYIINDYFDLDIDTVNKPEKLVVDRVIIRRIVIVWHIVLSLIAVAIGFYIDFKTNVRLLGLLNAATVALLFIYSISLKKKLLAGNILISLLTSWVILVVVWCETSNMIRPGSLGSFTEKITRISFLYAGFAFIISLVREVVKDMEDVDGDRKYGCTTMPIAWGFIATKVFVAVWLVVLMAALVIVQFYVLQFRWWWSAAYCIVFIIFPLVYVFKNLFAAKTSADFHKLSALVKLVMFTGILSMIFFRIYL